MISIAQKTLGFQRPGFLPGLSLLMPAFSLLYSPAILTVDLQPSIERSSTTDSKLSIQSFGDMLSPNHFRRRVTRPVSYYALFKGLLLLSQLPGCLSNSTSFFT